MLAVAPVGTFRKNVLHFGTQQALIYPLPTSYVARMKSWGDTGVTQLHFEQCRDRPKANYVQYTSHKPYEKYTAQMRTRSLKHTINGSSIQFYVSYSRLRILRTLLLTEAPAIYSVALLLVRVLFAVVVRGLFSAHEPAFRNPFVAVN